MVEYDSALVGVAHDYEVDPSSLEIWEEIGEGNTAKVYRGNFRTVLQGYEYNIEVAIKTIDWNKASMGAKEQLAFDREVQILPEIDHENLVKFWGVCSLNRPFRVICEYCRGGCAFDLLHNADHVELMLEQQMKMAVDVAAAMKYLHEVPIVHRDLKSLNLLLTEVVATSQDIPHVKVSDLGLARMQDVSDGSGEGWGRMTKAAGTFHWMAPEVFHSQAYDEKVDVYSFSMVLFEVFCREIPFEDEEPINVGQLVCEGHRPDLEAVPPGYPRVISNLMQCCWAENPAERPPFERILPVLEKVFEKVQQCAGA